MTTVRPSEQMRDLGVVQYGAPVLAEVARPFDLPAEKDTAEQTVETLFAAMERIARVHITTRSQEMDEQFEGCLSFFDVRGMVPRPLTNTVVTTEPDGTEVTTVYERGLARLVAHEIDHLDGLLYTARMRAV
ncbi:peptide deformylase [Streptomyces sp. SCA3-4]|uniref:peptide deformylase n=1 Tax=Streptomyces sichuanensis TaxID=2871810 RepID=UPI001CE271EE|nr:peptide deformylase [Streptomyces sichuanensis]MCA6091020.1 peptide deformylase [Streptomyces sichuanensis]